MYDITLIVHVSTIDATKEASAPILESMADCSIPLEDKDTESVFLLKTILLVNVDTSISEKNRFSMYYLFLNVHFSIIDATKATDACSEDMKNSENFLKIVLQNLPTTPDQTFSFNGCVERFRKDLYESSLFSFEFKSDLDLEEISLRRRSHGLVQLKCTNVILAI